jgi:C1A family cysteine protease
MTRSNGKYGWARDREDKRDRAYAPHLDLKKLPQQVDLRPKCPSVYEQRPLQSCTANAVAGAIQFERLRADLKPDFIPSRLFVYYNERKLAGLVGQDSPVPIRDAIKALKQHGHCPEDQWPYDVSKYATEPPQKCYQEAVKYQDLSYRRLEQNLEHIKACLASGHPFMFGFFIYSSFESPAVEKSCVVPLPAAGEKMLGGHAVMAVGYDDRRGNAILRNSWGPHWAQAGYFEMPYAYITDAKLACDLWTLRLTGED